MPGIKKLLLTIAAAFSFILASVLIFGETYPVKNPKANVCILNYETGFKKNLTAALVHEFNAEKISVTVDTVSNGSQYSATNYDAVILLSAVQAWNPLPKTSEYIIRNNYSSNIIYFSTYKAFNFPYGFSLNSKKIDAITSASVTNDQKVFDEATNRIIAKTMSILNKKIK